MLKYINLSAKFISMKKNLIFIGAGVLILLIGFVVGWISNGAYFQSHKEAICSGGIEVEFSPEQIQKLTSLTPGQVIYGIVKSKQGNLIGLDVQLINPLNKSDIKTVSVDLPIEEKDVIVKFKRGSDANLETVKASFDEIKVGDYLTVQILPDKKIIGLSVIEK